MRVGAIVRLKSGGPEMTVQETVLVDREPRVTCNWFENGLLKFGAFHPEMLGEAKVFNDWWESKGLPHDFKDLSLSAWEAGANAKEREWITRAVRAFEVGGKEAAENFPCGRSSSEEAT